MVASFCLRLAAGMLLMLPLLPAALVPPRFYRVHFLTALGLLAVAAIFTETTDLAFRLALAASGILCIAGSIVWHLQDAPGGTLLAWVTPAVVTVSMLLQRGELPLTRLAGDDVLSALVLGSATTAMLMGHSYLISPTMSMVPLMRLLAALAAALTLRIGLACFGLWCWTSSHGTVNLETDVGFWLPARWVLGLIAPLVLGWMAWETARIRSTQSATGILYVVVIVCFLGELTSMLLLDKTTYFL